MKEVLIAKETVTYGAKVGGGTIAGFEELDQLVHGALAVLTEDGTLVTGATTPASIANVKQFYVAVGRTNDVKKSKLFDRDGFHRSDCAYVAPVLYAFSIGNNGTTGNLNLPATLIAGTIASFKVGFQAEGIEPMVHWQRYEHTVTAGDTNATILASLVAKVNNDPNARWSAAIEGANLGITLTADNKNELFYVTTDDILADADRLEKTALVYSKGDPDDVRFEAKLADIQDGDTNRVEFSQEYWKVVDEIDNAATYDQITIEWQSEHRTPYGVKPGNTHELMIAIPDGTQKTAFDAVLALVLSAPTTTAGGSSSSL